MLNFNNIRSNNRRRSYAALPRAELYEELGDGLNIQIHSKNQRFIERIKEAYVRLKYNPIGIRLVNDIRRIKTSTITDSIKKIYKINFLARLFHCGSSFRIQVS